MVQTLHQFVAGIRATCYAERSDTPANPSLVVLSAAKDLGFGQDVSFAVEGNLALPRQMLRVAPHDNRRKVERTLALLLIRMVQYKKLRTRAEGGPDVFCISAVIIT